MARVYPLLAAAAVRRDGSIAFDTLSPLHRAGTGAPRGEDPALKELDLIASSAIDHPEVTPLLEETGIVAPGASPTDRWLTLVFHLLDDPVFALWRHPPRPEDGYSTDEGEIEAVLDDAFRASFVALTLILNACDKKKTIRILHDASNPREMRLRADSSTIGWHFFRAQEEVDRHLTGTLDGERPKHEVLAQLAMTAFEHSVALARLGWILGSRETGDFIDHVLYASAANDRIRQFSKGTLEKWPLTYGSEFLWLADDSALHVSLKFVNIVLSAVNRFRPTSEATKGKNVTDLALVPLDPLLEEWHKKAMIEIRDIAPLPRPTEGELSRDYQRVVSILRSEVRAQSATTTDLPASVVGSSSASASTQPQSSKALAVEIVDQSQFKVRVYGQLRDVNPAEMKALTILVEAVIQSIETGSWERPSTGALDAKYGSSGFRQAINELIKRDALFERAIDKAKKSGRGWWLNSLDSSP
jgi:hypothetical protein